MAQTLRVGIVAPSSVVPQMEFNVGAEHLRRQGFDVRVHPQVAQQHFTFAGTDEARAGAIWEYATDPSIDLIWCARGGYGAQRLLPLLDEQTRRHGPPPHKLLVGYSDITVLHEFVRRRWGWHTLHAPMPAATNFRSLKPEEWSAILGFVRGESVAAPWASRPLTWLPEAPRSDVAGPVIGGNLALWASLAGTPFDPPRGEGKILFFEDINEALYRIDRMVVQIEQAGGFEGCRAILLGDFTDCNDEPGTCLKPQATPEAIERAMSHPGEAERVPLRPTHGQAEGLLEIFGRVSKKYRIPLAGGMPVGHGPNFAPLPLGAEYRVGVDGRLELLSWGWNGRATA